MSGSGAKKEKDSSSGSGILSGLLLAGGAAAMGFLAKTMYDDYKEHVAAEECMRERRLDSSSSSSGPKSKTSNGGEAQLKGDVKDDSSIKDEDVSEATRCIVCMDSIRQVIIEPCGHVCLCKDCARRITKSRGRCPVCHGAIADIKCCYLP